MLRVTSASRAAPTIGLKNTHARAMVVIESERPTTDANSSAAKLTAVASSQYQHMKSRSRYQMALGI